MNKEHLISLVSPGGSGPNGEGKYTFKYTLESESKKYALQIVGKYDENGLLRAMDFNIGGSLKYNCLEGTVYYKQNRASLDTISFHEGCSLNTRFDKGLSMQIIKAYFQILKEYYPQIKVVKFTDLSSVTCGTSKVPIRLAYSKIASTGKTWYEHHLKAKMQSLESYEAYCKSIERLSNKKPFDSFENLCSDMNLSVHKNIDVVKNLYDESETYKQFIEKLYQKFMVGSNTTSKHNNFCDEVMLWFEEFMIRIIDFDNEWCVYMDDHDKFADIIVIKQKGGNKKTKTYNQPKYKTRTNMTLNIEDVF